MTKLPTWLKPIYEQVEKEYSALELPKAEKTHIKNWDFEGLETVNTVSSEPIDLKLIGKTYENVVVIRDGAMIYKKLTGDFEGVIISTLEEAFENHQDLIKPYFGNIIPANTNRLTALNFLNLNSGLMIYVTKNKVIEPPLHVIYIGEQRALMNHNLIILSQSSQLKYIESELRSSQAVANLNTEIVIGENAKLDYTVLETFPEHVLTYKYTKVQVQANGNLASSIGSLSEGHVISENLVSLVGAGASAEVKTIAIAQNNQKQNITVEVEHLAPHTMGNIMNHGITKDKAQLVFNGIGKIHKGMHGSDAQQSSRAMILSETARADANPLLLIEEYDVTAGHAAGVGKIDEEQMYYLMSRGLSRREAETLIIHGFLMPFVNEIQSETVQVELTKLIEQKIKA